MDEHGDYFSNQTPPFLLTYSSYFPKTISLFLSHQNLHNKTTTSTFRFCANNRKRRRWPLMMNYWTRKWINVLFIKMNFGNGWIKEGLWIWVEVNQLWRDDSKKW